MATTTATKTYITINGEDVVLTNALALEIAVHALSKSDNETLHAVADKLEQHRVTLTKKSVKSGPTKAQVENADMASALLGLLPDTPVTLDWVAGQLHLVGSDGKANKQKAYQVVKVLLNAGKVVKVATKSSEAAAYQLL